MGWFKRRADGGRAIRKRQTATDPAMIKPRLIASKTAAIEMVACATVDGRQVVAAATRGRGVLIWDPTDSEPDGRQLDSGTMNAVLFGAARNGVNILVARTEHGKVRAWELESSKLLWEHEERHSKSLVCAMPNGRAVLLTEGPYDVRDEWLREATGVRVWDLASGDLISEPLGRFDVGRVGAMRACGVVNGRTLALAMPDFRMLQVWDLVSGEPVGKQMRDFRLLGSVSRTEALSVVRGRPVVITGQTNTYNLLVWDPHDGNLAGQPLGHDDAVLASTCTTLNGKPVLISGGRSRIAHVWDLEGSRKLAEFDAREGVKPDLGYIRSVAFTLDLIILGYSSDIVAIDFPGIGR
jgi:WD40 repeat protein